MKLLLITAILLVYCMQLKAQTFVPDPDGNIKNTEKYWWYRYRLVNDFLKIGDECGESIPAQRRYRATTCYDSVATGTLQWADATIDLGNYIAALATEHRQLHNNGLSTARTDMELYYALQAFDRLDKNAEAYCYDVDGTYPCNPQNIWSDQTNGFFIRDDVPYTTFLTDNYDHFNRPGIRNKIPVDSINSSAFKGRYDEPGSDVAAHWTSPKRRMPSEESQDQIVQLAMGMALAANEPGGIYYGGINLSMKAGNALFRMINHVDAGSPIPLTWTITNPVTTACVYGTDPSYSCADAGALFTPLARGAALATQRYSAGYASSASGLVAKTAILNPMWQLMQFYTGHDDYGFWGTFAALTDSWYIGIRIPPLVGPVIGVDKTWRRMMRFGEINDHGNFHLPLLYRAVFYVGGITDVDMYRTYLDLAPTCGVHNYNGSWCNRINWSTGIYEHNPTFSDQWSGNDAIHEWYHRRSVVDNSDCNGLDYMTMFNLYGMEDPDYMKYMFNSYYREDFDQDYPITLPVLSPPLTIGSSAHKLKLNFLEYVSAVNTINSDGYLTMRCAKVIDLKPGFQAKYNCNFLAYIEDYSISCGAEPCEGGIAGDAYHYAELTYTGSGNGIIPGLDSTVYLNFPPDGVPFVPDSSAYAIDPVDSIDITCEMEHAYFDSLIAEIYANGDQTQIDYLDSFIIPNTVFPECDSNDTASYRLSGNYREIHQQLKHNTNMGLLQTVHIFPNPNNGSFTIEMPVNEDYYLKVWNVLGNVVYEESVKDQVRKKVQLDSKLPPGNYMVEIISTTITHTEKITVVK